MHTSKREYLPSIIYYLVLSHIILIWIIFPSMGFMILSRGKEFKDRQLASAVHEMEVSMKERGASLARAMAMSASQAIAGFDFTFLNLMLKQVAEHDPEIVYCIVMNQEGIAAGHSENSLTGTALTEEHDLKAMSALKGFTSGSGDTAEYFVYNRKASDSVQEIMEVVLPVYSGDEIWGVFRCGYSRHGVMEKIAATEKEWAEKLKQFLSFSMLLTAGYLIIGIVFSALLSRIIYNSIKTLNEGINRVQGGDLDSVIPGASLSVKEFRNLAEAFNVMTVKLKDSYRQLDEYGKSLEIKVEARTHELKKAQQELMRQAHEAGMAEMAVGVLHNIGNALTPAKVKTVLIAKRLKQSPLLTHLSPVMSRISQAVAQIPEMPAEEKERIGEIVTLLPQTIAEEYNEVVEELESVSSKQEHIEHIIRLQMQYAHVSEAAEEIDLVKIVDDAIEMLDDSMRKRNIKIIKEVSSVPLVRIEKSKMIQVVVNLIKNAYEATDETTSDQPHVHISVFSERDPSVVVLSIKDNGVGFQPSEAEKLFKFGYTTKDRGTGFGLHSCANYIIANHGTIKAVSEGTGKGAEFIIQLPAMKEPCNTH